MRRFVKYLVLFCLPVFILLVAGECLLRHYPNSYSYKSRWMEAHAGEVRVLLLGASHTYYSIAPEQLSPGTFSLANVSQPYEIDWYLLSRYADRLDSLTDIILVIDDITPFDLPLERLPEDWYRCTYYRLYMDYDKHSRWSRYGFELSCPDAYKRKLPSALSWLFTGRARIDCDSLGQYRPADNDEPFDSLYMLNRCEIILERHRCKDWSQVDRNCAYLYKIAQWCSKRRVRLTLVTTPMWQGYYTQIPERQSAVMYGIAHECVSRYGARFLDYLRDTRFYGSDFSDGDHLSAQGAEKFTRILRADMGW